MNKKILVIDIISFISSIILFIFIKLSYTFIDNNFATTIVFATISIIVTIASMLFSYRNHINDLNYMNIILCVIFCLLLYIIYNLPFFNFVGQKGVNNSVCLVFEFLFGGKYLIYFSYVLKSKSRNEIYNINKKSLNSTKKYYKFFSILGMYVFIAGIIVAIFNAVIPVIDVSVLYQMIISHKSLFEIMN